MCGSSYGERAYAWCLEVGAWLIVFIMIMNTMIVDMMIVLLKILTGNKEYRGYG